MLRATALDVSSEMSSTAWEKMFAVRTPKRYAISVLAGMQHRAPMIMITSTWRHFDLLSATDGLWNEGARLWLVHMITSAFYKLPCEQKAQSPRPLHQRWQYDEESLSYHEWPWKPVLLFCNICRVYVSLTTKAMCISALVRAWVDADRDEISITLH